MTDTVVPPLPDTKEVNDTIKLVTDHAQRVFLWNYDRERPQLVTLYNKAMASQWNSVTELDWSTDVDVEALISSQPQSAGIVGIARAVAEAPNSPLKHWGDKEFLQLGVESFKAQLSQFMHGEQGAMMVAAKIVETVPWIDAKYYAATQTMDEARHTEVFAKYLHTKLGDAHGMSPFLEAQIDALMADSRWDIAYLGMQIVIESLALAAFGNMLNHTEEPLLKKLLRYVLSDEARHVAFGVLSLKEFYGQLSDVELKERQEFLAENTLRSRARAATPEIWERMGVNLPDVLPFVMEAAQKVNVNQMAGFQRGFFSKLVPNVRKLGLLDANNGYLRKLWGEAGLLEFEFADDTASDFETYDAVAADRQAAAAARELTPGAERDMAIIEQPAVSALDVDELQDFLRDNWDPDLTVKEWWHRLGLAGWCAPMLPTNAYGRALTRGDAMKVAATIAAFGAVGAPQGMGIGLVSPTIATHGTQEQIDRFIPDAVSGKLGWCQLFSEPGAGSDLAGLSTKAVKDGDLWHVDGQKVWTSGGQWADMGMLIARTNPEAPKHQGITWFAFDMHQPGVDIRPLKEMTGHAMFNEVFLTDAIVHDDARIGDTHNGWAVANTTLFHERSGMGARGGGGAATKFIIRQARAGTVANDLDKRVGDFVSLREDKPTKAKTKAAPSDGRKRVRSGAAAYIELARKVGKDQDPNVRQRLAQLHTLAAIAGYTTERHKAVRAQGGDIPGVPNFSKLGTANMLRLQRDLGMELLGARGMLHSYTNEGNVELAKLAGGAMPMQFTAGALSAQALPIFGGTDQIQRNIIGERVLGLPKEPGDLANLPFNQLPKNG